MENIFLSWGWYTALLIFPFCKSYFGDESGQSPSFQQQAWALEPPVSELQDGARCLGPRVSDRPCKDIPSAALWLFCGQSELITQRCKQGFCQVMVSSKPWVHSGSGLIRLLFFFLIALKFWLRIIVGSIENKDKSDFPCIPKGLHDSPLFHLQTDLELQVFLVGFQALIYWDAVISMEPEKITIALLSALQASMLKTPFSLWPSAKGLSDLGSLSSYVNRVRSEWSPRFPLALYLWLLPGHFSVFMMTFSWRCRFTYWLFLYFPPLIVFPQDMWWVQTIVSLSWYL